MYNPFRQFTTWYDHRRTEIMTRGAFRFDGGRRGYVLILVLIMTTLLVTISSEFIAMTQTNIGYTRKMKNRLKASYLARSGVEVGKYILYADSKGIGTEISGKPTDKNTDSYNDIWALDWPEVPVEGTDGSLKMEIQDENAKINLSVLANEFTERTKFYIMTQNFFIMMGFTPDFADIIHDWVDIDDSRMPYGAETQDFYTTLPRPYTAKNNAMDSIDELLMLKNMTPEIFYGRGGGNTGNETNLVEHNKGDVQFDMGKADELTGGQAPKKKSDRKEDDINKIGREHSRRLSDYFTVYGDRTDYSSEFNKININTASFRVLSALTENMTPDIVTEIIRRRKTKPFASVNEISDLIEDKTILDRLGVKSFVFRIIATATVDNTSVRIQAIYNRGLRKTVFWCEE